MSTPIRKATQQQPQPAGSIYPKFVQSPKVLAHQEYGRPGLQYWLPGYIKRDWLPELQGRQLHIVFQQMGDNDAYVGASLNAHSLFLRRATWHVDPGCDENKENGSAEFLESCMGDMQHTWQTIMATAARPVLQFGLAPFEKIFKLREGEKDDARYSSEWDDGAVGWQNFAFRSPDTILHWDYDPQDVTRLLGFTQIAAPDYKTTFIPIEKIVNLRSDPGKDSPEGRSMLRSVWRSWRTKSVLEDFRNVIIERGGAGIPWVEAPAIIANAPAAYAAASAGGATPSEAVTDALASYNSLVSTLENIAQMTQNWVITPQVWDPETTQPTIKIGFLQPSQNADIIGHITSSIDAEAKSILIAMLSEFQALGMGGTGSLALSRDKTDNFTLAVAATLSSIQDSINQQAVRQLFQLNPQFEFEKKQPKSRIVYDPLVPLSTTDVVAILGLFEKAGWSLDKQSGIRDAIIKNLGLPDYIEQQTEETLQENGDNPISSLLDGKSALDALGMV